MSKYVSRNGEAVRECRTDAAKRQAKRDGFRYITSKEFAAIKRHWRSINPAFQWPLVMEERY